MKVLYFDCFSGISGDMTLGALLDLGIEPKKFFGEMSKINIEGLNIEISGKNNSAVIERVKAFVADHMNEKFTREDIALRINLNPAYLSRIFKKETGISLSEYILRQRIECAKELLIRTNDKISTIAESLGYYHFSHFAKIFKEFVGIGPNEYRRKFQSVSTAGE